MKLRRLVEADPTRIDFFALLRALERGAPGRPRIGRAQSMAQEIVRLEQPAYVAFPESNIQKVRLETGEPAYVEARFLGYFGPQGALPLLTTDEAMQWELRGDDSFVRFANIFATRFLQLFYRAWADARPIVQYDQPHRDRFSAWIGCAAGIGTEASRARDTVPDTLKYGYIGVLGARVKSARRLQQAIRGILKVRAEISERAGLWLDFEPGDLTRLGQTGASLGRNSHAGARVYSINDKAVIEIRTESLAAYEAFLPGGDRFRQLADIVRLFLGDMVDFDVRLALPAEDRPPARLGLSGRLGWTAWSAPPPPEPDQPQRYVADATFRLTGAEAVQ